MGLLEKFEDGKTLLFLGAWIVLLNKYLRGVRWKFTSMALGFRLIFLSQQIHS